MRKGGKVNFPVSLAPVKRATKTNPNHTLYLGCAKDSASHTPFYASALGKAGFGFDVFDDKKDPSANVLRRTLTPF